MSPTWQLPALGPRGDPWAGCRVSASPACGLPGPWEHSWVRSACTPGGSRATPPGGPPPGEQPGALARGRLLHTGVLGGSRVLGDSVRLLASCPRAQHKHHCSPPPRVPPRGATARPPPGDPDPQPRRPHRIPELRPQGRPLSKPPGPGDPESWAGAPAPRPGPHRLGPPGEKCLLRGRPTAPSAVAVVWGSGGCRKAPHPVLCPCRSLTDPRGPYWLEHCPLPLHPPMPLAKGAPRRGQSRGRGRGAGGTHPSGSCSGAPTLPSVLTRPWKRVGRCVLRGLHRAEDHTGQGTPPAGGSRGDWATPGAESGPRWPEEGPALEPPCSRLSTGRATKRCHGERPAVCCREGGASPDLVSPRCAGWGGARRVGAHGHLHRGPPAAGHEDRMSPALAGGARGIRALLHLGLLAQLMPLLSPPAPAPTGPCRRGSTSCPVFFTSLPGGRAQGLHIPGPRKPSPPPAAPAEPPARRPGRA